MFSCTYLSRGEHTFWYWGWKRKISEMYLSQKQLWLSEDWNYEVVPWRRRFITHAAGFRFVGPEDGISLGRSHKRVDRYLLSSIQAAAHVHTWHTNVMPPYSYHTAESGIIFMYLVKY
jgi:hypothetical protein